MKQIELILTVFFSLRKKLERGSPLLPIRHSLFTFIRTQNFMIYAEGDGTLMKQIELIFTDFFPCGKFRTRKHPIRFSLIAIRCISKMIFTDSPNNN
jgi:hypothetical protein